MGEVKAGPWKEIPLPEQISRLTDRLRFLVEQYRTELRWREEDKKKGDA